MRNLPSFEVAFHTDVGYWSDVENSVIALVPEDAERTHALFLVADGWNVQDKKGGEYHFNRIAVDTIRNAYERIPSHTQSAPLLETLVDAMKQANSLIHPIGSQMVRREDAIAHDRETLMWSFPFATCTAVVVDKETASFAHVGRCRAYLLRQGQAKRITYDHTWTGGQVRAGTLAPQEERTHPRRTLITRYLGGWPDVEVDVFVEPVQDGDILVLCTHRFAEYIEDEELGRLILPDRLQESVEVLIQLARRRDVTEEKYKNYANADNSQYYNVSLMAVQVSMLPGEC